MSTDTYELTNAINDMTRQLGIAMQNVRNGGPGGRDRARLEGDLLRKTTKMRDAMGSAAERVFDFSTSMFAAKRQIADFAAGFAGGAIVGMLERTLESYTETYKGLADIGQTFGGSMLEMGQAAAGAALPLEQYADALRANSKTIARIGREQFFNLSKNLRDLTYDVGMFGLSSEQMTDGLGAYLETLRISDIKRSMSDKQQALSYIDLLKNTTNLASAMGTSREEINGSVQSVLNDAVVAADLSRLPKEVQERAMRSLSNAAAVFAAQGGEVGKVMTDMIRQSIPAGTAIFSDLGKTMINAGAGDLIGVIDPFISRVKAGTATMDDSMDVMNTVKKYFDKSPAKLDALIRLAATGDDSARQFLDLITNAREITEEQRAAIKADIQKQQTFTAFLTNLSNLYYKVSGTIREGFLGALEATTGGIAKFGEWLDPSSSNYKANLVASLRVMGETVGNLTGQMINWIGALKPEDITGAVNALVGTVQMIGEVIGNLLSGFKSLYSGLASFMDPKWAAGVTALTAFVGYFAAKKLGEGLFGAIGSMFVRAANVVVTGGIGGDIGKSGGGWGKGWGAMSLAGLARAGTAAAGIGAWAAGAQEMLGSSAFFDYLLSGMDMPAYADKHMEDQRKETQELRAMSQGIVDGVMNWIGLGKPTASSIESEIAERVAEYEQTIERLGKRGPGSPNYNYLSTKLESLTEEIAKLTETYATLQIEQLKLQKESNQVQKDIKSNTSE